MTGVVNVCEALGKMWPAIYPKPSAWPSGESGKANRKFTRMNTNFYSREFAFIRGLEV